MYYLCDATCGLDMRSKHKTLKAAKAAGERCRIMDVQILQGDSGLGHGLISEREYEAFNQKEVSKHEDN